MRILDCSTTDWRKALATRTILRDDATTQAVADIIADVRNRGDEALLDNARKFDCKKLKALAVSTEEIETASLTDAHHHAIRVARDRIVAFHSQQFNALFGRAWDQPEALSQRRRWRQPKNGAGQRALPVGSAGVYVPGGAAAYPSSVLMNGGPARMLGVDPILVTTPARQDGTLHPAVLVALRELGIRRAFKIGGAAAIAALAIGTQSVRRVDVVVGPGNRFVNEAKRQLWGQVGLDGYAGPSEVAIMVDATCNPKYAAADLLTQIEHAPDNCGFLVSIGEAPAKAVLAEIESQLAGSPREATMRAALDGDSLALIVRDAYEALDVVNTIAPEHLSIATREAEQMAVGVRNAGCVFIGDYSPQSAGDFVAGPSHTLPTAGAARFASGVNILTFMKFQSVIRLNATDLQTLTPIIESFGEMEGFPQHARGATVRQQ